VLVLATDVFFVIFIPFHRPVTGLFGAAAWDRPALSLAVTSGGSDYAFQATLTPAFHGCDSFITWNANTMKRLSGATLTISEPPKITTPATRYGITASLPRVILCAISAKAVFNLARNYYQRRAPVFK
jgi:hypothetical protein